MFLRCKDAYEFLMKLCKDTTDPSYKDTGLDSYIEERQAAFDRGDMDTYEYLGDPEKW